MIAAPWRAAWGPLAWHRRSRPRAGAMPLWALTAAVALASVVTATVGVRGLSAPAAPIHLDWWLLAALFCAAEMCVVHVRFQQSAHSFSLTDIALVLGLFFTSPGELLVAEAVGTGLALMVHRRQTPFKLLFNVNHLLLETSLALLVFHAVVPAGRLHGPLVWAGTLLATEVSALVGALVVAAAIALTHGELHARELPRVVGMALVGTLGNTAMTLVFVTVLWTDAGAAVLLVVPAATLFAAYRGYTSERRKREGIANLSRASRLLQRASGVEEAVGSLLDEAATMFRAEHVEILLVDELRSDTLVRSRSAGGARRLLEPVDERAAVEFCWGARSTSEAIVVRGAGQHPLLDGYLAAGGVRDAMVASLDSEGEVVGAILVGNRLGDLRSFRDDERDLFDTFVTHASIALRKCRIEDRLRHDAFHDALTGIGNRALFVQRCQLELDRRSAPAGPAVLFIDLDDFKDINDTLGHGTGDALLAQVAERLERCVGDGGLVARLGGDEFAVLLTDDARLASLRGVAARIADELRPPFRLPDADLTVSASIGIATATAEDARADDLLGKADMAMFHAKACGKGRCEVFLPEMQVAVSERHQLRTELERAFERQELVVHYQPIVTLDDHALAGFEALVRWNHPRRGLLAPDHFVPFSEESGQVRILGRQVLEQACTQAATWARQRPAGDWSMTVNLSVRQLEDPALPDELRAVLARSGVEPRRLVLEITETMMAQDYTTMRRHLQRLKDVGVRLAVDDFGTGYSSLSYLSDLPIDIIKLAKPFVDRLASGPRGRAFTEAVITLGKALGLRVIAEGVETAEQLAQLRDLGCDMAQGYHVQRPAPASEVQHMFQPCSVAC